LTWSGLSTGDGVFTASATSGTVAAGGSGTVTLTFTPTAATSYSSTLTVTSDATSGTNTTTVWGTGIAATRIIGISGDPSWADIRADDNGGAVLVGSSLSVTFNINNTGNRTLAVSGIDAGNSVFTASPTSGTVAAGASMTVTVTFTPSGAGNFFGAMVVSSDATSLVRNAETLSGIGR